MILAHDLLKPGRGCKIYIGPAAPRRQCATCFAAVACKPWLAAHGAFGTDKDIIPYSSIGHSLMFRRCNMLIIGKTF